MKIRHVSDYRARRRAEYPPIEEQLDALWKAIAALPGGALAGEGGDMLKRIQGVKAKFRKDAT